MSIEVLWEIFLTLAFPYILQPWNISWTLSHLDGTKASTELGHIAAACGDLQTATTEEIIKPHKNKGLILLKYVGTDIAFI